MLTDDIVRLLKSIDLHSYGVGRSALNSPQDQALYEALAEFGEDRETGSVAFPTSTSRDDEWVAVIFASKMATLAVRDRNAEHIRIGLLALLFVRGAIDLRDAIVRLAPLYDAGLRLRTDVDGLFRSFERYSAPMVTHIVGFPDREPAKKSLDAM